MVKKSSEISFQRAGSSLNHGDESTSVLWKVIFQMTSTFEVFSICTTGMLLTGRISI